MTLKNISALVIIAFSLQLMSFRAIADDQVLTTPEMTLVSGLMAAAGDDLSTKDGQTQYKAEVNALLAAYARNHTADISTAKANLADAFQAMGIPDGVIAKVQSASNQLAKSSSPTTLQLNQTYAQEVTQALQSTYMPEGEQFSACQWSVGAMLTGFAIGIPVLIYSVAEGMGDASIAGWLSNLGSVALLVGIGGLIAQFPACSH